MKFALCFSGYPRFVKKCFPFIEKNLLNSLKNYDIYALFQWDNNWNAKQIHHEYKDTFAANELEDFKSCYNNIKKLKIIKPIKFDVSSYDKTSNENDLIISLEQAKQIYYRFKCQYKCISDCTSLIKGDYDYIIRMRTDLIVNKKLEEKDLYVNTVTTQNGFCAGWDRPHSDWFIVAPYSQKSFFNKMDNIEKYFESGIVHMHKLIKQIGEEYNIQNKEYYVDIPSTTKNINFYKEKI
jgi:hypothetical protein